MRVLIDTNWEELSTDYIVTRNTKDFFSGQIPVVTPEQFIQIIKK